jgi:DNA-binding response OmpR family regulator
MSGTPDAKRLLIIDDDESLREVFEYTMTKAGFIVASAEDGVQGLAKVPAFKPHLIVLDLMMPNLNGFEVIHKLQALGLGSIPVIVVTGYSDRANENIIHSEANVVDFLKKPINYADLVKRIKGLLA